MNGKALNHPVDMPVITRWTHLIIPANNLTHINYRNNRSLLATFAIIL